MDFDMEANSPGEKTLKFHTTTSADSVAVEAEQIVRPDLPVVDAHFHVWNMTGFDYFAPEYLRDVSAGHKVEASIYVECDMGYSDNANAHYRPVGETEYVMRQLKLARGATHDFASGIVGSANLLLGEAVRPILESHLQAGKERFRGIRARIAWDSDPVAGYGKRAGFPSENIVTQAAFLEGTQWLQDLGLILETWGFHTQLRDLCRGAAHCPELNIVLNHLGGPLGVGRYASMRDEVFKEWSAGLRAIAEHPNVHIKLSGVGVTRLGFGLGVDGRNATSDDIVAASSRYVKICVETFGPERCIFGSNYPVDKVVGSYPILLNAYKKMLSDLSDRDQRAVFSDNARRIYRI
ncbi:amidohydrolase family protein [Noviherbaspirillum sedimenti]|uniref:Amidohydrolase n=1 Tax=Noviherbaspirillum sedimenti TaxID=2320865 RepID=A0A3A3G5Q5_9BURK|nr:amidohydrolase family protein [Noviherbaspirillum sedimenti]RJG03271.1 amidohydrolase [Noviherbaspirillum sedimenti]